MSSFYRERDPGYTDNQWTAVSNFDQWQQAADFNDGDSNESDDTTDARALYGGKDTFMSQGDLAG